MGIARTNKAKIISKEQHAKKMQDYEADNMRKNVPQEPMTLQRVQNAATAHRGFIKWLGIAELAMHGIADRELRVGGFAVDRMGTEHWRSLRLLTWEIAVWNLNYFQGIASRYVILSDAELTRAGCVRDQLDLMKKP